MKCLSSVIEQRKFLNTRYPYAVANNDQVIIDIYNNKAAAQEHVERDPNNLVAFDASGISFEPIN